MSKTRASYWQRGESLDYVNETGETIEAGEVVALGERVGVAAADIAPGEKGVIDVEGVYEVPKGDDAIEAGREIYFRTAAMVSRMGKIATASAVGTYNSTVKDQLEEMEVLAIPSANGTVNGTVKDCIRAGYATQDAEADAGTVFVKINA